MIDKKFWTKINENQADYDKSRRIIISQANIALHLSKQVIFALHRDNLKEAEEKIKQATDILKKLQDDFGKNRKLRYEGAWSAALEEYVEANLFLQFVKDAKVGKIEGLPIESNEYLGGLCDYTGELLRRAILQASKRKYKEVEIISEEIHDVAHKLLEYNLTGPLRTKFDQAKRNLNKIEQTVYEINLKNNS